jgi:hypothetical protein
MRPAVAFFEYIATEFAFIGQDYAPRVFVLPKGSQQEATLGKIN